MTEVTEADASAVQRLRLYLERTYLWYLGNVERVSVYLNQQHHLTGENRTAMRLQAREFEQYLRELLAQAKGAGALAPDIDLKLAAFFILGALNGLPRWYHTGGAYSPEAVAEQFTELSIRALMPEPKSRH